MNVIMGQAGLSKSGLTGAVRATKAVQPLLGAHLRTMSVEDEGRVAKDARTELANFKSFHGEGR